MAAPEEDDWRKLERPARYLIGCIWAIAWFDVQDEPLIVETHSDSDWAGCRRTRRSTSGGCTKLGRHLVKAWSKTQATIALSSAEAELYAAVKASAETIGMMSILKDFGIEINGTVLGDASAALGIIQRQGLGKLRHIDTNWLWVQEKSLRKEIKYGKVPGAQNPADALTKYLGHDLGRGHVESMGVEFRTDKAGGAIELNVMARSINWDQLGHELKQRGARGKHNVWTRTDDGNRNYRTSSKGGPDWDKVRWRATFNEETGELMNLESADSITKEREHRPLCKWPIRTTTALISHGEDDRQAPSSTAESFAPAEGECKDMAVLQTHTSTGTMSKSTCEGNVSYGRLRVTRHSDPCTLAQEITR
jgi:hypothetical protein